MDKATVIGIILGVVSILVGFTLEGGHLGALFQKTAALIVFGGTFGAVMLSYTTEDLKSIPKSLKLAIFPPKEDALETIDRIVELSTLSRREGILALESKLDEFGDNKFVQEGFQLVVDGVDPSLIRDILETEIAFREERNETAAKIFETAGGYAPTMGIIGTVMGLVHVLGNISDPSNLGPAIAVAFIATLYGVSSANVLYLPLASKLKQRNRSEILIFEMQAEGILSIQAGENPKMLRKKLLAFLTPKEREKEEALTSDGVGIPQ